MAAPHNDDGLRRDIEEALATAIDSLSDVPGLVEACRYAALGGGKRIRPIIVYRVCEACGGSAAAATPGACAVELVHAFSLVHDDLPAIDDDDVRRGRPTLHRAFPESLAILAGDALFAMGLSQAMACPTNGAQIAKELTSASLSMIDGQVLDTLPHLRSAGEPAELVRSIHQRKTGALIAASARIGALVAGANTVDSEAIARWGEDVGLMFQVVDDWIDATQPTEHVGKATGKDAHQGKLTWTTALGVSVASSEIDRLRDQSLAALAPLGGRAHELRRLTHEMAARTR